MVKLCSPNPHYIPSHTAPASDDNRREPRLRARPDGPDLDRAASHKKPPLYRVLTLYRVFTQYRDFHTVQGFHTVFGFVLHYRGCFTQSRVFSRVFIVVPRLQGVVRRPAWALLYDPAGRAGSRGSSYWVTGSAWRAAHHSTVLYSTLL